MLISPRALVDRLRHPRSRTDELRTLRKRLDAARRKLTAEQRRQGKQLRVLRQRLAAATGKLSSCAECARGCAAPAGRWDGGYCCSNSTANLFCDDEVASLAAGGTRTADLVAPSGDHAGCAFRGPTGCSLDPGDRPNRCVLYLCRDAAREVHAAAKLDRFEHIANELSTAHARFTAERRALEMDYLVLGGTYDGDTAT